MNKHTPGPWSKDEFNDYAISGADGMKVAECAYMCTVKEGKADFSEMAGNAHLISAAPEMLEALQFAVDELQLCSDEQEGRFGKTLDKLLAVIDKAKGEQHA